MTTNTYYLEVDFECPLCSYGIRNDFARPVCDNFNEMYLVSTQFSFIDV